MKTYIQDIRDMSDSREMLEAKPHFFLTWFVYILIAMILVAVTWSYFGSIEEYVKSSGIVRPGDKVSTIRNLVAGKVERVDLEEGQKVAKGDLLYTVDTANVVLERDEKAKLLKKLDLENANLIKLKQSILKDQNLFDVGNTEELDYYTRYQKYVVDRRVNAEQIANANLDLKSLKKEAELSMNLALSKLETLESQSDQQAKLLASLEQDKNLVDAKDTENYGRYESYRYTLERYAAVKQQREDQYGRAQRLYAVGGISKKELEASEHEMAMAVNEYAAYKNETALKLNEGLKQNRSNLLEIQHTLDQSKSRIETYSLKGQSEALIQEKMRLDMLVQIEDSLAANTLNRDKTRSELRLLTLNISEATVTAPIDGYVNLLTEINHGDLLQSGAEIATIVPGTEGDYKVQLMVYNKDISGIRVGQRIKYQFHALPYREYGEVSGLVHKIGSDARLDKQSGMSYYIVEASMDEKALVNDAGEASKIKIGMACDARVVTKSKRILFWFLEKINLRD